jgi:nitrite reductase/ring-hydroxylating ferredoxin subunit
MERTLPLLQLVSVVILTRVPLLRYVFTRVPGLSADCTTYLRAHVVTVIALSAACTHLGCLVQWQRADRKFHCPCHDVLFIENGLVDKSSNLRGYLPPLPRLETKIEDGKVYVRNLVAALVALWALTLASRPMREVDDATNTTVQGSRAGE